MKKNKRKRGKAKPLPIEAKRLARDIERLNRLESYGLSAEKNREILLWAKRDIVQRLLKAAGNVETLDHLLRAVRGGESKAERVIRAYWPRWNAKGLQWGERQAELTKMGFNHVGNMKRTGFRSLCARKLGLKYRPAK